MNNPTYFATIHPYPVGSMRYAVEDDAQRCKRGMKRLFRTDDAAFRAGIRCVRKQRAIVAIWLLDYGDDDEEVVSFVSARADVPKDVFMGSRGRRPMGLRS